MHCSLIMHGFHNGKWLILCSKSRYNIPGACLLNRSPVPAMDLKAIDQACDVKC